MRGEVRILHVDDDPEFVDLTTAFLKRENTHWTVETATSASEGIELVSGGGFDCIVSDYDMPDENGIEFLRMVRADDLDLPFILFTGKGSEEIASDAISAGVSDYLRKGASTERYSLLANRITNLVRQYRAEANLERRLRQQELVAELGQQALAATETQSLFERTVQEVSEALDTEYCKVLDYQPESDDLLLRAGVGWQDGLVGAATVGAELDSQAGYTLRSAHPIVVDDLRTEDRFHGPPLLFDHDVVSGVSVIIGTPENPWGVLGVHTTAKRQFTEDDVQFVQNVANILAHTIRREQHLQTIQESESQYRTLFESIWDPIVVSDRDRRLVDCNQAFTDRFGYTPEEIRGETSGILYADETEFKRMGERAREQLDKSGFFETTRFKTKEGEVAPCELKVSYQVQDDEIVGYIGLIRDISERQARERELQERNDRLEEFASVVSHDLRNPLSVIQGRIELARDECRSDHLDHAATATDRSLELIDDLLLLAREGERVHDVERVNLKSIVEKCWQSVATADATLVVETDQSIEADSSRLRQLLENLIRNAVEHGGEDVSVTVGRLSDGFFVADDGVGISEKLRDRIFDVGYSTAHDGTGFGLNIVEDIADAHGWNVQATENESGGARFEITGVTVDE